MNVLYCPVSGINEAKKIARILVEKKLAVCCNIIDGVYSIYFWKGAIHEDSEAILIVKTLDVQSVTDLIKKEHSYEEPVVLSFQASYL